MSFSIQKANFWKRFSAWLVDSVLVFFLALALFIPLMDIPQVSALTNELSTIQTTYKEEIEAQYSIELDIPEKEYEALSPNDKAQYDTASAALNERLNADSNFMELRSDRLSVMFTIACSTVFVGILLAHFVLPLILKNGQTLGKKTFGIAVIRTNGVKISPAQLFIRSMVGLFAIETMAVVFLLSIVPVGTVAAILVQALQIGVMIKTPHNGSIHDLLADTAVVEFISQRIFETEEERVEYIARLEREAAEAKNEA
jgi:uncharacterized RDD family membrane protein YckC